MAPLLQPGHRCAGLLSPAMPNKARGGVFDASWLTCAGAAAGAA